jgi:hypothetical protein
MRYLFFFIALALVGNVFGQSKNDSYKSIYDEIAQRHKRELDKAARKIKVTSLKNAKFKDNEAELRIWMIDYFYIQSFILRRKNEQREARYISFDNQEGKMKRNVSFQPKNGWQNLNQYLTDKKLDFDLELTPEEENLPLHPDANYFLIEARTGKKYNMYWYIMNTRVEDGKKAQNLCDKIGEEFNLEHFSCKY